MICANAFMNAVNQDRLIGLLRNMIRIKSYSNTPGEGELARYLEEELKKRGLSVSLQEVAPARFNTIAWLRGGGNGKSLMFNGHIDTNMVGLGWTKDPFSGTVENGFLYGIGVSNMKSADAAMAEAVTAVRDSGVPIAGDVCLALVVGELQGGVGTMKLIESGIRTDYFIVGEPTDLSILTLHAGSIEFAVHVTGRTRHLSKMEEGISAIEKMITVIRKLKELRFDDAGRPDYSGLQRLNIGSIRGGIGREYLDWRTPMVPDFCTVKVAIRVAPSQSPERVIDDIRMQLQKLKQEDPELEVEVERVPASVKNFMPAFEIDRKHPFVRQLASVHREVTGMLPYLGDVAPYKFYGTDAGHLASRGKMEGVVYGPGGKFNTMPDERVEIADIVTAAKVYALMILDSCGVGR